MSLRYFIDCKAVQRAEAAHLVGLLFHAAHGFISRHGLDSVALAWPAAKFERDVELEDEEEKEKHGDKKLCRIRHPHPGGTLRVFAPEEAILRSLAEWEGVDRLVEARAVLLTGIRRVPEQPEGWCHWRRTRAPERDTDAYILRTEERFLRRQLLSGIAPEEAEKRAEHRRLALLARQPDKRSALFLSVRSKSTACRLSLFIERVDAPAPLDGVFNRYGLSSVATVPVFG